MFILNPHSGIPIYRQLQEQIRRLIASGQLKPGDSLPSIRDLAVRHTINPMTVSKAYSALEAEGVLERHRGKPMTVARQSSFRSPPAARLRQLEQQMETLVLAGHQLELSWDEVINALREKWEKGSERSVRDSAQSSKVV